MTTHLLTVTEPVEDQGTVVVFDGIESETDLVFTFAVDHRCAQALVEGLCDGEDVEVEIEAWQVIGAPRPLGTSPIPTIAEPGEYDPNRCKHCGQPVYDTQAAEGTVKAHLDTKVRFCTNLPLVRPVG